MGSKGQAQAEFKPARYEEIIERKRSLKQERLENEFDTGLAEGE